MEQKQIDFNANKHPLVIVDPINQKGQDHKQMTKDFIEFHNANKAVYSIFKKIAQEMFDKGFERFSMISVTERFRWEYVEQTTDKNFKINDKHGSFYARLLACDMPELRSWFKFKRCKADNDLFYEFLKHETGVIDPVAIFISNNESEKQCQIKDTL
ncbi:MAG: hypothetical protein DRQ46_00080 [Gammaproteobacteria bacterium]|nr:MAG: hypothetical protein DRQ46_00080 [Gammaproteobacteria bacterium]